MNISATPAQSSPIARPRRMYLLVAVATGASLSGCARFENDRASIRYDAVLVNAEATGTPTAMVDP